MTPVLFRLTLECDRARFRCSAQRALENLKKCPPEARDRHGGRATRLDSVYARRFKRYMKHVERCTHLLKALDACDAADRG